MALISSQMLISSISLFHITLAYFFLVNPKLIDDQALVFVLGESMGMPEVRGFDAPSPQLAFLAVVLASFGLSDLFSLTMPEEFTALYYWGTQAPLRFFLSMLLVFYTYTFGPSSPLFGSSPPRSGSHPLPSSSSSFSSSSTDGLKNRVLFSFAFIEMLAWFWTWITLRDERDGLLVKMRKQHAREHAE
ncbi:hypothetical protein ESCO_004543 [Escovopsis weberi]|uniref:Increased loss of mitochondrial DNA protein 1 n=1 Tax=Escovopsis weberi TaxID=150374 RepID=A0A0M9VVE1_ESCWE|nr:hypothetical protein ESCO_004543 [Escovopsis weberi]